MLPTTDNIQELWENWPEVERDFERQALTLWEQRLLGEVQRLRIDPGFLAVMLSALLRAGLTVAAAENEFDC